MKIKFNKKLEIGLDRKISCIGSKLVDDIRDKWSKQSPSFPGQAPGIDTGNLDSNIYHTLKSPNINKDIIDIVADTEYVLFLEYGTENMQPRPFMYPELNRSWFIIKKELKK